MSLDSMKNWKVSIDIQLSSGIAKSIYKKRNI